MLIIDSSSVARTVTGLKIMDGGSVLRTITGIKMRDADNVLQTVLGTGGAFDVLLDPANLYGYGSSPSAIFISMSGPATVHVSGGTPPYTYTWNFTEAGWTAFTPTSPISGIRSPSLIGGDNSFTLITVTVEDDTAATVESNAISAYAENLGA